MTNNISNKSGSDGVSLTLDKHFLPEWLEKYPVFGLEMKLAWRRLCKFRIFQLLLIKRKDSIASRLPKEIVLTAFFCVFVFFILVLLAFPGEFTDYISDSLGYMFSGLLYPLAMLLFVIVSAVQGSDCYHVSDDFSFYKQLATTGIKTERICSELLLSGLSKFAGVSLSLTLLLLALNLTVFYGVYDPDTLILVLLYIGLFILSLFIYIVSSTFGTTRLPLINRRFVVLGFWLATIALPVLIGYLITRVYENLTTYYDYDGLTNVYLYLTSFFPLGSLITFPAAASGDLVSYHDSYGWMGYGFIAVSVLCQVLYSLIAHSLARKLFNRRLSE